MFKPCELSCKDFTRYEFGYALLVRGVILFSKDASLSSADYVEATNGERSRVHDA